MSPCINIKVRNIALSDHTEFIPLEGYGKATELYFDVLISKDDINNFTKPT